MSFKNLICYVYLFVYRPTECQPLKEADKEGNFYLLCALLLCTILLVFQLRVTFARTMDINS